MIDYLDPDVAYLVGMIAARGVFSQKNNIRKIIITFPFKNLIAIGITKKFDQQTHLHISVDKIRKRVQELLEVPVDVVSTNTSFQLIISFQRNTLFWRNLKFLMQNKNSYREFRVPPQIIEADETIQKEFIRGFADVAGYIRESNNYMNGKRRVYLEVQNENWFIPIDICYLLQEKLNVPVQLIQWGHPNTREPYRQSKGESWAREHQIKIFSEAFQDIGFYVDYKQEILEEFIKEDRNLPPKIQRCNPNPKIRKIRKKPKHPDENSSRLPDCLRGRHFDAPWQICLKLGCKQKKKVATPQLEIFPDEEVI